MAKKGKKKLCMSEQELFVQSFLLYVILLQ